MEIHAHGFLLLGVFFWRGLSRILRGILRLSISGSQPLVIDLRYWPQIWRRALSVKHVMRKGGMLQDRCNLALIEAADPIMLEFFLEITLRDPIRMHKALFENVFSMVSEPCISDKP